MRLGDNPFVSRSHVLYQALMSPHLQPGLRRAYYFLGPMLDAMEAKKTARQQDQANADRMRAENLQRTERMSVLKHPITVEDFGGDMKAFVAWRQAKDFPLGWAERDNRAML